MIGFSTTVSVLLNDRCTVREHNSVRIPHAMRAPRGLALLRVFYSTTITYGHGAPTSFTASLPFACPPVALVDPHPSSALAAGPRYTSRRGSFEEPRRRGPPKRAQAESESSGRAASSAPSGESSRRSQVQAGPIEFGFGPACHRSLSPRRRRHRHTVR